MSVQFTLPTNFIVAGPSQSGKSTFLKRLILESDHLFVNPPGRIIYVYSIWSDDYAELEGLVEFRTQIPSSEELLEYWGRERKESLLILDDMMHCIGLEMSKMFTATSHHARVGIVLVLQNLFYSNKFLRDISLNTQCFCLFKNSRTVQQVKTLASQMYPGRTDYFMESFSKATDPKFGYLVVDLNCPPKFALRSNIFKNEDTILYLPKNSI